MSHLTVDRITSGRFNSEKERKGYQLRYFIKILNSIDADLKHIKQLDAANTAKYHQDAGKGGSKSVFCLSEAMKISVDLRASVSEQQEQSKIMLRCCLPIRAYMYGLDVTRDLISFHNKLTTAKSVVKEMSNEGFKYVNEATFIEKMKTILESRSDAHSVPQTNKRITVQVPSKYLTNQGHGSKQDQMKNFLMQIESNLLNY